MSHVKANRWIGMHIVDRFWHQATKLSAYLCGLRKIAVSVMPFEVQRYRQFLID